MSRDQGNQIGNKGILYPRLLEFQGVIKRHHEMSKVYGEPQYLVLDGPHRSGKTWLVKDYAKTFPRTKTEEGLEIPVMHLLMPSLITTEILARKMLDTMNSPIAYKENKKSLDACLIELIRASQVELIVLDNFYYLTRSWNFEVADEVLTWLLALVEETRASLLVISTEDSSEILYLHPHLSQRFTNPMRLAPFDWNPAKSAVNEEFTQIVWSAIEVLGTCFIGETGKDAEFLYRLHYATDGIIGHLMNLLHHAVKIIQEQHKDGLDFPILSTAFEQYRPVSMMKKKNPFLASWGETFLPPEKVSRNLHRDNTKKIGIRKPRRDIPGKLPGDNYN